MTLKTPSAIVLSLVSLAAQGGLGPPADHRPSVQQQGQADTAVYDEASLTEPPERISFPMLKYPSGLLDTRTSGQVLVSCIIGQDGRVEPKSIAIVRATDPGFIKPATEAVQKARFKPGRINGHPVRTRVTIPLVWSVAPRG